VVRKGAGYAIEGLIATGIIIIFVVGGLQIPESSQDWNQFRDEVAVEDLSHSLKQTGLVEHTVEERETGSLQTTFTTISEKNLEISGTIKGLPVANTDVGFYSPPEDQYSQEMSSTSSCEGTLEISDSSGQDIRKATGGDLSDGKTEELYLGDNKSEIEGYDTVWIDEEGDCNIESGPFIKEEIFKWGGAVYDLKTAGENEITLHKAGQVKRLQEVLNREVNSIEVDVAVDTTNLSDINRENYDILVIREDEVLEDIQDEEEVRSFIEAESLLALANLSDENFDSGDLLREAGFMYRNVSFKDGYSGSETEGVFLESEAGYKVENIFDGLNGDLSQLALPAPNTLSNTEASIQSSKTVMRAVSEEYNFSEWNRINNSMMPNQTGVEIAPESACYFDSDGNEVEEALTVGELQFPDGENYRIINAEIGSTDQYCENNNQRRIVIEKQVTDETKSADDQEEVVVANREYTVKITGNQSVEFEFSGNSWVELISNRRDLKKFNGDRIAVAGYEKNYEDAEQKVIAGLIHWLQDEELEFGRQREAEMSTTIYSGTRSGSYMPYEVEVKLE
jgi:hypothetical protein